MGFNSPTGFGDGDAVSFRYGKFLTAGENIISVYDYTAVGDNAEVNLGHELLFKVACPSPLLGAKGFMPLLFRLTGWHRDMRKARLFLLTRHGVSARMIILLPDSGAISLIWCRLLSAY